MVVEKKKYIIELPENTHWIQWIMEGTKDHHPYMDYKQVEDLTLYTEPDTEAICNEAYQRGYKEGCDAKFRRLTGSEYQRGLSDAWEYVRKIYNLCVEEREALFPYSNRFNLGSICEAYSVSEAIEKIRQYEQGKEEQIQVGDEVRNIQCGWTAVVSAIDRECMTLMDTNGKLGDGYDMNRFIKTGRHFPEIAEVLKKMRETIT